MTHWLRSVAPLVASLALASCSTPTQPLHSQSALVASVAPMTSTGPPTEMLEGVGNGQSQPTHVTGAFRDDAFVITVHGVRLQADYLVHAGYDVDPESQGSLDPANVDFIASGGKLWPAHPSDFTTHYLALVTLKEVGNGFTYSVPLSAMNEPTGPIAFAITVQSYEGTFYFSTIGWAECRQCAKPADLP